MIPYGRQQIDEDDIQTVVAALESDFLTQGPLVEKFENAIKAYCYPEQSETLHAVAVNSATSALHIACLSLGVGAGDLVWTSPITFVASANCALYCGAEIDFVDIDPSTANISIDALVKKLQEAEVNGRLPKVVIPVHFAGQPCDMAAMFSLSQRYGFQIIEDAAHAIGSSYQGHKTGACQFSDITVFSFHPVKIITSAEGGMALTREKALADKMCLLAGHGITRDPKQMQAPFEGNWGYQQVYLGFNYRMSDVHAALGLSQLNKLERFVEQRNAISRVYDKAFSGLPCKPLSTSSDRLNSYHLYMLVLDKNIDRAKVYDALREQGLGVNVHYIPVYKQPYYRSLGFAQNACKGAEQFYQHAITLPLFPAMTAKDQYEVIDIVSKTLSSHAFSSRKECTKHVI